MSLCARGQADRGGLFGGKSSEGLQRRKLASEYAEIVDQAVREAVVAETGAQRDVVAAIAAAGDLPCEMVAHDFDFGRTAVNVQSAARRRDCCRPR